MSDRTAEPRGRGVHSFELNCKHMGRSLEVPGLENLVHILESLASDRPVFHSEADFQFALSGKIQHFMPGAQVRLEYRPFEAERVYLDIWVSSPSGNMALELKYVTRKLTVRVQEEPFDLLDQSAQDSRRYDFLKDVMRLEHIVEARPRTKGYAVFLTNDPSFWTPYDRTDTTDAAFRIHQGRFATGTLAWSAHASAGTIKGREAPLALRQEYMMQWRDYASPSLDAHGQFRFLLLEVGG